MHIVEIVRETLKRVRARVEIKYVDAELIFLLCVCK